jgi:hypothetical protein
VIGQDVSDRLLDHYRTRPSRGLAVPLFAVLGAALIGLGTVLLLAHNWESFSRAQRAALSFALLLGAQVGAGYALMRRRSSVPWGEAAGVFLVLASGATIALIGQTYHVPGNLRSFLSSWLWLALPVPYLFLARGAAALCLGGLTAWLVASLVDQASLRAYWGYLAGVAPLLVLFFARPSGARLRDGFLGWVAVPALALGMVLGFRVEWPVGLGLLIAAVLGGIYAGGALAPDREGEAPDFASPARTLAGLGIACATLVLARSMTWREWLGADPLELPRVGIVDSIGASAVGVGLGILAGVGVVRLAPSAWPRALLAAFPAVAAAGVLAVEFSGSGHAGMILMNAYGLALGIGVVLLGLRESRIGLANAGLFLIASLIFDRFVDLELSYTVRGLSFIVLGVCFLLLNLRVRRAQEGGRP